MIVVPDDFPAVLTGSVAEQDLRKLGEVVIHAERGANEEAELARRIGDAEAVLNIRAYAKFTKAVLDRSPKLRIISIWGTGTDHIDLMECERRGITVANTAGVNAHAVAEHTLALMLAITRRIPAMDRDVRRGEWPRGLLKQLEGHTLGIVGLGAIGRRVAALAAPFGMRLLTTTAGEDAGRGAALGAEAVSIEKLLAESDIVTLHMRLDAATEGMLNRDRLALMKPTAFLINTARAGLVDRVALVEALAHGQIAGAALDVFHQEPLPADDPLLALSNVILTPHNAGMSREVIENGLRRAVGNIGHYLRAAR